MTIQEYRKTKCKYLYHYNDMGANIYSCDKLTKFVSDFTLTFYPNCIKCKYYKEKKNV